MIMRIRKLLGVKAVLDMAKVKLRYWCDREKYRLVGSCWKVEGLVFGQAVVLPHPHQGLTERVSATLTI